MWETWKAHVAAGGKDDGRFEPLRQIFAPSDGDMLLAAVAVKWLEIAGHGQVMWELRRAMSPPGL